MSNILYFPIKLGSDYFRVTSSSKPSFCKQIIQRAREIRDERFDTTPARKKREILLSVGWSVYDGETVVAYSNPDISNNDPHFLDDAWNAQILREHGERYFKS